MSVSIIITKYGLKERHLYLLGDLKTSHVAQTALFVKQGNKKFS